MGNKDLALLTSNARVATRCRNAPGEAGVLGVPVRPDHPADDLGGILFSAVDGLFFGCGDATISVDQANESVESTVATFRAPGRPIASHAIPTQASCPRRTSPPNSPPWTAGRRSTSASGRSPGVSGALRSFGAGLALIREGHERVQDDHLGRDVARTGEGAMDFETGKGSASSAEAQGGSTSSG